MTRMHKRKGYIALMTMIVVTAVAILIVSAQAYVSITQGMNSLLYSNYLEAGALGSSCADDALLKLKNDHDYAGNETISLGHGQCQIYPIQNLGGEAREIRITASVNDTMKKIRIRTNVIDPNITFDSWEEVADF